MEITINSSQYQCFELSHLPNQTVFRYKTETSILLQVGIKNDDVLCEKIRHYFYGIKVPIIKNRDLLNHYQKRNIESNLLEIDFRAIKGVEPFIVDLNIDGKTDKYIIIDIDALSGMKDPASTEEVYIGNQYQIKFKRLDHFRMQYEKYHTMEDKVDAIALMHDLLESIISEMCVKAGGQPVTNFKQNLEKSGITNQNEKALINVMKDLTANSGECEHPIPIESEQSIPV